MGEQRPGKWVVPNPQIPRTFGIMNLVFGILMFLVGAGYIAITIVAPSFQKQMVVKFEQQQAKSKAEREAKVAELKAKEEAAKTKEEKDTLKDEREAVESNVEPDLSAMNEMMGFNVFSDVRLAIYTFSELISGMILNVLMVISGVGLLGLAEWGRRLAITVAWLKIVRWVAMIVVTLVLIVPITAAKIQKMFDSIQQAQARAQANAGGRGGATMPMLNIAAVHVDCRRSHDDLHRPGRVDLPGSLDLVSDAATGPRGLLATIEAAVGPARDATGRTGVNLATLLFGHLAGTECRRALARGWLIVVRSLLGLLLAAIAFFLIWMWWLIVQTNASYVPSYMLRATLAAGAMILLTIVVVQAPAVLAGSLAGDRERGVLQLLLTTVVSPREIVSGRLLGKLSQVGMIVLAGVPFLVLLGAWNGLDLLQLATLFLLLAAVGAGGGGLAVLASITSRRGAMRS